MYRKQRLVLSHANEQAARQTNKRTKELNIIECELREENKMELRREEERRGEKNGVE